MDAFGLGLAVLAALALLLEPSARLTLTADLTLPRCESICARHTRNSGPADTGRMVGYAETENKLLCRQLLRIASAARHSSLCAKCVPNCNDSSAVEEPIDTFVDLTLAAASTRRRHQNANRRAKLIWRGGLVPPNASGAVESVADRGTYPVWRNGPFKRSTFPSPVGTIVD